MSRKKVTTWIVAILGLIVLILVGAYAVLRSQGFERYVISKLVQSTNEATGGHTEIRKFSFEPSTLTANLYGVTVRGKEASTDAPLLHADRLMVRMRLQTLLHGKLTFQELLVDHPVVHLRVNAQGQSNLPQPPPSTSKSQTNVFDLAVAHALLSNGEIYADDQAVPLNADLYNLKADFHFDPASTRYLGSIAYDRGQVAYLEHPPLSHSFNASLGIAPDRFVIDSAVLKVGGSRASIRVQVADFAHLRADGQYEILLHGNDLNGISPQVTPAGDVSLKGTLRYQAADNQPLLKTLLLNGDISSEAFTASSPDGRFELRRLSGTYALSNGIFQTRDLKAETLGGNLSADIHVEHLDTQPVSRIHAAMHNLSLQAAQHSLRNQQANQVAVLSRADGTLDAYSAGTMASSTLHAVLRLREEGRKPQSATSAIPVTGLVDVSYDGRSEQLALRHTTLNIPSAALTADGQLSRHSNVRVNAHVDDLKQLAMLASAIRGTTESQLPDVAGSAVLNANIQGPMQAPHLSGDLQAQNLQVQGSEWSRATVNFHADPAQFVIDHGTLASAHQGSASFNASVGLRRWSYLASNPVSGKLSVQQLSIADLERLANANYPFEGNLSGDISIHGTQLDPMGSGSLKVTNGRAYGEPIDKITADFNGANGSVTSKVHVASNAGVINAQLGYTPKSKAYTFHLDAPTLTLQKVHAVQSRNLGLNGVLSASGDGKGTIDDPQLTATVQLTKLEMRKRSYSDVKADLHVAQHRADVTLHSQLEQAAIQAHGTVDLRGNNQADLQVDTGTIAVGPLLAAYTTVPEGFDGQVELHGTLKGPLKDKTHLEGSLTVPIFRAHYQSIEIGVAQPMRARFSRSILTIDPTEIRGTGTSLRIEGNLPFEGKAPATLAAKGTIDAQMVRIVQPDLRSAGLVTLDIRSSGSGKTWGTQGQIHLQNIAVSTPDAPMSIDKLNGTLDVTGEKVQISQVTAQIGGGEVNLGGSVTYRPKIEFNVAVKANSVRFRYPEGVRTQLGGNLALVGTTQAATLNGRVLVESLSFTPDFDLSKLGDQFEGNVPSEPGFTDNIKLQVAVQSTGSLSATSSQLSLEGRLNLQAIGTVANPVIIGRTDLTGGELFYRNVRYKLQRGVITFDDPNETHPVMNVAVTTTVEQYNLTLNVRGSLDKLTTSYMSEPPLATADIINLLARGRTTEESNAASQSTDALVASQAASQVSSSVQKFAGLSSLQIDPLFGGNSRNPSARVAIQQRVTKNFLFTFSTDVSQPGEEIVQGDYQVTKRWSVSVSRDELGGVSVDGRYHTRF
jgi:translocation and assembly module TamB